eukprot:4780030-Lingulodinium_polyedra.AAC.1
MLTEDAKRKRDSAKQALSSLLKLAAPSQPSTTAGPEGSESGSNNEDGDDSESNSSDDDEKADVGVSGAMQLLFGSQACKPAAAAKANPKAKASMGSKS